MELFVFVAMKLMGIIGGDEQPKNMKEKHTKKKKNKQNEIRKATTTSTTERNNNMNTNIISLMNVTGMYCVKRMGLVTGRLEIHRLGKFFSFGF